MENTAEAQIYMTQYTDPLERVLRRALREVRSDIAHNDEHIAKYPTIGRALVERCRERSLDEEFAILTALTGLEEQNRGGNYA